MTAIAISIFLVSAASLAFEILLIRALAIGHWYHFSYLIISTALLGFGAGGSIVTIMAKKISINRERNLWRLTIGLAISMPTVFYLSQQIPFDELQIIWDWRQVFYLLAYYLLYFIPFLFAGSFVALAFCLYSEKARRIYFYNMTGCGIGIALIVILMYDTPPANLILPVSIATLAAAILLAWKISRRHIAATILTAILCVALFSNRSPLEPSIHISENKAIVYFQSLPEAKTITQKHSPIGRIDIIDAPAIRIFDGLSINYTGNLCEQAVIITDGHAVSPANKFKNINDLKCYTQMTSTLPYKLIKNPQVCILEAGGGSAVTQAIACDANHVTAVINNGQLAKLLKHQHTELISDLYHRPDVKLTVTDSRNFLMTTGRKYDIINLSHIGPGTSAGGMQSLNESHLYTIDAISQALKKLKAGGVISVSLSLESINQNALKMFATIADALTNLNIKNPADNIIMIRNWSTATVIASPQAFSSEQLQTVRTFANQNAFDIVYLPGIKSDEPNRFHVLQIPLHPQIAAILSKDRDRFFDNYAFNIRPATDDRPYFFDFFRFKSLRHIIRTLPENWLIYSQWAYLLLWVTLIQALLAGIIFIITPLLVTTGLRITRGKFVVLIYFLMLGLAYMFLEMGFIQKMTLLIGHPVFGVAATLAGFLVFSGLGSITADRLNLAELKTIKFSALIICILGILILILFKYFFGHLVSIGTTGRIFAGLAICGLMAFFMGMPFPSALKILSQKQRPVIPWAFAINGFASVTGAVGGILLAMSAGFTVVMITALVCYVIASLIAGKL